MVPQREQVLQIARLVGIDAFTQRFGAPQTAQPNIERLHSLVDERLGQIARHLVEEAAASDDVTDVASAESYLADRLTALESLLQPAQAASIRDAFRKAIEGW